MTYNPSLRAFDCIFKFTLVTKVALKIISKVNIEADYQAVCQRTQRQLEGSFKSYLGLEHCAGATVRHLRKPPFRSYHVESPPFFGVVKCI